MNDNLLNESRNKIEAIDEQLCMLFVKRMAEVKSIALYKSRNNMTVTDTEREKTLFEKNKKIINRLTEDTMISKLYNEFFTCMLSCSKKYQKAVIKGNREDD